MVDQSPFGTVAVAVTTVGVGVRAGYYTLRMASAASSAGRFDCGGLVVVGGEPVMIAGIQAGVEVSQMMGDADLG